LSKEMLPSESSDIQGISERELRASIGLTLNSEASTGNVEHL
jgi:hypothetical protein